MEIKKTLGKVDPNLFLDNEGHIAERQAITMTMLEYSQFSHKLSITRRARHKSHPVHSPMSVIGGGQFVHLNGEQASLIEGAEPVKTIIEITGSGLDSKKPNSKFQKANTKKPNTKFKNKTLDALTCSIKDIEKAITPTGTRTVIRDRYNRNKYWEVTHNQAPCYHYIVRQVIETRNVMANKTNRTTTKKTRFRKADLLKVFEI